MAQPAFSLDATQCKQWTHWPPKSSFVTVKGIAGHVLLTVLVVCGFLSYSNGHVLKKMLNTVCSHLEKWRTVEKRHKFSFVLKKEA